MRHRTASRSTRDPRWRLVRHAVAVAALVGASVLVVWLAIAVQGFVAEVRTKASLDPDAEIAALEAELDAAFAAAPSPPPNVGRPIDAPSLVPPAWRAPATPAEPPPIRPSTPRPRTSASVPTPEHAVAQLRLRRLTIPVQGVRSTALYDSFDDPRSGGRTHRAIDISAPRGTPVVAVEAGRVAKLFQSRLGGIAIDLVDTTGTYLYYYAHLDGYAPGLRDGDPVARGQVLGYVGSTGNASSHAPHLHFSIRVLPADGSRSRGRSVNPYPVLRAGVPAR